MGEDAPTKPLVFLKPPSTRRQAAKSGDRLFLAMPPNTPSLQPECEVVVWLTQGGSCLTADEVKERMGWVTIGLDVTKRDLQTALKRAGQPWALSKVFADSAVLGPWISIPQFSDYMSTPFELRQGERIRQRAVPNQMILKPAEALSWISHSFALSPGDVLFTGTPGGVSDVSTGDRLELRWGKIHFEVEWQL